MDFCFHHLPCFALCYLLSANSCLLSAVCCDLPRSVTASLCHLKFCCQLSESSVCSFYVCFLFHVNTQHDSLLRPHYDAPVTDVDALTCPALTRSIRTANFSPGRSSEAGTVAIFPGPPIQQQSVQQSRVNQWVSTGGSESLATTASPTP